MKLLNATLVCLMLAAPAAAQGMYYQTYSPTITAWDSVTNTPFSGYRQSVGYAPAPACCGAPAVTYAPAAATTYYAPAATTTYYAPTTTYYAPAPTVAYSPVTAYYAPAATVAYSPVAAAVYRPVVAYSPVTTYYSPAVAYAAYSPVVYARPYYIPGEPVRNFFRALAY